MRSAWATNSVHKATTLQAAESATELVFDNSGALGSAFLAQGSKTEPDVSFGTNSSMALSAELSYTGKGPAIGDSLGNGQFEALRFEAAGTARLSDVKAASRVVQGAYIKVPAGNGQ